MDGECSNCGETGNWCRCDEEPMPRFKSPLRGLPEGVTGAVLSSPEEVPSLEEMVELRGQLVEYGTPADRLIMRPDTWRQAVKMAMREMRVRDAIRRIVERHITEDSVTVAPSADPLTVNVTFTKPKKLARALKHLRHVYRNASHAPKTRKRRS